jgi:hypothetical protein
MKSMFLIIILVILSCRTGRKTQVNQPVKDVTDSIAKNGTKLNADTLLPECVKKLIAEFKSEEKQIPPRSIISYYYNGNRVYYVPPICCDFFSDLYDSNCKLIAHPDGGFTGRGDGKAPDFITTRSNEKLLWKDERE